MKRKVYVDTCKTASTPYSTWQGIENVEYNINNLWCTTRRVCFGKDRKLAKWQKTSSYINDLWTTITKTKTYYTK